MRKFITLFLVLFVIYQNTTAQTVSTSFNADSISAVNTVNKFLEAFRNLEFEKFRNYFAEDVTVFFPPSAKVAARVEGKANVESVFKTFFDKVRTQKSTPPYLDINPQEMKVKLIGNIAIVTFQLNEENLLDRRTILFEKQNDKWLIVHLHASNIDVTGEK